MGSFCLSAVQILRCPSLSRIENILLLVPTALEVLVSSSLVFVQWDSGRKPWLLTAEAWMYLLLSILDLLSHVVPAVRDDLDKFRIVDILLAAVSVLPLFLYTLFLYLFTRADLLNVIPRSYKGVLVIALASFIPLVITLHELGSFLGISRRWIPSPNADTLIVGIGFATEQNRTIWTTFTNLALGFFTVYQAVVFSLTFIRLAQVFINKRRIEDTSSDEAHLFQGLGWIAGGLKLGAIETVVGFVQGGFGVALGRRILRFLGRACLSVGLIKGMDFYENFEQVRDELDRPKREKRRSRIPFISNPRFSTFQQMSPSATAFYSAPRSRGIDTEKRPLILPDLAAVKNSPNQRVTVHFDKGAPTLEMRFSTLDMPSPAVIAESVKSRPSSEWTSASYQPSLRYPPSPGPENNHLPLPVPALPPRAKSPPANAHPQPDQEYGIHNAFATMHNRGVSDVSMRSEAESVNSLFVVRQLTAQFPGLPSRVTGQGRVIMERNPTWSDPYASMPDVPEADAPSSFSTPSVSRNSSGRLTRSGSTRSSIRRKPVPSAAELGERDLARPSSRSPSPSRPLDSTADGPTFTAGRSVDASYDSTPVSTSVFTPHVGTSLSSDTTPGTDNPFVYDENAPLHTGRSRDRSTITTGRSASQGRPDLPSVYEQEEYSPASGNPYESRWIEDEEESAAMAAIKRNVRGSRIKSVGKAPHRYTPNPVKTNYTRDSIYIEAISIPPREEGMPEVIQGSYPSMYENPLRDSEVLGIERWSNGGPISKR